MFYIDLEIAIRIHDDILNISWWLEWIKDKQQLESIITHIQNNKYYPEIIDKLIHLFFGVIKFHCFNDGNKRTAIWLSGLFLYMNDINIEDFMIKMEDIAIWVAKWEIDKKELKHIFKSMFLSFWYNIWVCK